MTTRFKSSVFIYFVLFMVSIIVNFIWEIAHAGLYQWLGANPLTTAHLLWFSVKDALLYLFFIWIVGLVAKDLFWFRRSKAWHWALILAFGFVVSTVIERHAVLTGRWAYLESMPIIPIIGVGLSPVLQMTAGLVIVMWLVIVLNRNLWAR